jgi:hypothetical protein
MELSSSDGESDSDPAIGILEQVGSTLELTTEREFSVPMCRVDLVWFLELPVSPPRFDDGRIPLAGCVIESGWRTRKRIKGDISNLEAFGAPLGILVLQTSRSGDPKKVDALIRNSGKYINERGRAKIVIWTESDIIELVKECK